MSRKFDIPAALSSLAKGATWSMIGNDWEGLTWTDTVVPCPTQEEVANEIVRLQAEWDASEYQRKRAKEYPDFKEYLDGIVKGDQAQIQAYIDACQAVKDKYPKAE